METTIFRGYVMLYASFREGKVILKSLCGFRGSKQGVSFRRLVWFRVALQGIILNKSWTLMAPSSEYNASNEI